MDKRISRQLFRTRRCGILLFIAGVIATGLSPIRPAAATTRAGNAIDDNWSVAGNWSLVGVPAGGDNVNIVSTDGVGRTITMHVVRDKVCDS